MMIKYALAWRPHGCDVPLKLKEIRGDDKLEIETAELRVQQREWGGYAMADVGPNITL